MPLNRLLHRSSARSYRDAVLATPGLVGYWRLGDRTGTVARDELGLHAGTYVNAPVLGARGLLANDGDTAMGPLVPGSLQCVTVAGTTAIAALATTGQLGFGFWIKIADVTGTKVMASKWSAVANNAEWEIYRTTTTLDAQVLTLVGGNIINLAKTSALAIGNTYFVSFSAVNGNGNPATLYLNGVAVATGNLNASATTGVGILSIGDRNDGALYSADTFDEVSLFSRAPSAPEWMNLYRIGTGA